MDPEGREHAEVCRKQGPQMREYIADRIFLGSVWGMPANIKKPWHSRPTIRIASNQCSPTSAGW